MNTKDKGTNTKQTQKSHSNISTQCPESRRDKLIQTSIWVSPRYEKVAHDSVSFSQFLARATVLMLDELDDDCLSQVLTMRNGYFNPFDSNNHEQIAAKRLMEINSRHISMYNNINGENVSMSTISQVDWNSSGSILVVVYGNRDDIGLSRNPGKIELWRIRGDYHQYTDKPLATLDHESELNCVASHPQNSDVFATGSKNGEIVIFALSDDNILAVLSVSNVGHYFHDDAVMNVVWYYKDDEWVLYSTGHDGKLLMWSLSNKLNYPIDGYYLKVTNSERIPNRETEKSCIVGNTMSIFGYDDKTVVVIGGDCGHLFVSHIDDDDENYFHHIICPKFSMKWTTKAREILMRIEVHQREKIVQKAEEYSKKHKKKVVDRNALYSIGGVQPSLMYPVLQCQNMILPHVGVITSVAFCDGYLLSCANDGLVQLYRIEDNCQLQTIHTIETSVPFRKVIATFCSSNIVTVGNCHDGSISFHNLRNESVTILSDNQTNRSAMTHFKYNFSRKILAVARSNGHIELWQIIG